jgi:hypothetical protein
MESRASRAYGRVEIRNGPAPECDCHSIGSVVVGDRNDLNLSGATARPAREYVGTSAAVGRRPTPPPNLDLPQTSPAGAQILRPITSRSRTDDAD